MNPSIFLDRDLAPMLRWMGVSSIAWVVVVSAGSLGNRLGSAVVLILGILALRRGLSRGGAGALPLLAYLLPLEPVIRQYTPSVGYLFLEYLIVAAALCTLLSRPGRLRWYILF